jgi:hypothetical protein
MRSATRTRRWLWWLGILLAGASLFAPGGRDLPTAPGPLTHPLAAILYPTVGQDALVERPTVRVGQHAEPAAGRPAVVGATGAVALAALLLVAAILARRPVRQGCDRRVPTGRRRGPPLRGWMPRALAAPQLASA